MLFLRYTPTAFFILSLFAADGLFVVCQNVEREQREGGANRSRTWVEQEEEELEEDGREADGTRQTAENNSGSGERFYVT